MAEEFEELRTMYPGRRRHTLEAYDSRRTEPSLHHVVYESHTAVFVSEALTRVFRVERSAAVNTLTVFAPESVAIRRKPAAVHDRERK
jgi:hypothetical protein